MARPREHDVEDLLDHARSIWADRGTAALTIRALSAASGASNGAIYHAFGSRATLLARVWVREAERFLTVQSDAVDAALREGDPVGAVVAAALAPSDHARRDAAGARLLLAVSPEDLVGEEVGEHDRDAVRRLRAALHALVVRLADEVWGRTDPAAVRLVGFCVVDLPSALLLARDRTTDPLARTALERAVRGVLTSPPPGTGPGEG